jgi:hypothetical protein
VAVLLKTMATRAMTEAEYFNTGDFASTEDFYHYGAPDLIFESSKDKRQAWTNKRALCGVFITQRVAHRAGGGVLHALHLTDPALRRRRRPPRPHGVASTGR